MGKTLPVREVTEAQWAAVSRTIPNFWVAVAVWVPLLALLFLLRAELRAQNVLSAGVEEYISFSLIATVIGTILVGGRQAPWLGLGVVGILYYMLAPTTTLPALLLAALCYFGALALLTTVMDARLRSLLKQWKREATGSVQLGSEQERNLSLTKHVPAFMWPLTFGALIYPAIRLGWEYFSTPANSLAELDQDRQLDVQVASALLALCLLICLVRWLEFKTLGLFALEVPADSTIGPTGLGAFGHAILIDTEETENCLCRQDAKNETNKKFADPRFIFSSKTCPVHGIDAVNQLSREEFIAIADQPWVYGENLDDKLLEGTHQRMVIAGLAGWNSRPISVRSDWLYGGAKQASAYYLPRAAREPMHRSKRTLNVENLTGDSLNGDSFEDNEKPEIGRIDLRSKGINAQVVRVQGGRPFLI